MSLVSLIAVALHDSISADKLEDLFKSEWNQLFAATTFAHSKKCRHLYAVFLPKSGDLENGPCIAALESRIAEDCDKGKHSLTEIRLDIKP